MGIALFTLDGLLAPLRGLKSRFVQPADGGRRTHPAHLPARHSVAGPAHRQRIAIPACAGETPRPVKVVRALDASRFPGAGRMVISGRMADVCAELDRLAALEAAAG